MEEGTLNSYYILLYVPVYKEYRLLCDMTILKANL